MNLEPPPPPLPRLSSCHLHPDQPVTGFCASCLRERLAGLDPASSSSHLRNPTHAAASSSSSAAAALRAIFTTSSSSRAKPSKPLFPELRRCKSFSGAKADGVALAFEPQRKSCDVRARNTLWSLFHQDDENRVRTSSSIREEIQEEEEEEEIILEKEMPNGLNANFLGFDEVEEDIEAKDNDVEEEEVEDNHRHHDDDDYEGEIRVLETEIRPAVQEIEEEEEEEEDDDEDVKTTIKDHIDLDAQMKNQTATAEKRDLKEIAGSFWLAASVFSKKLRKWRRKKKSNGREPSATSERAEGPASSSRFFRETQSEVADYGFGRRSCDTDPRFSLDAGRISFEDARYSFDEPRASWDGYLIGRTHPRMPPMMMDSVVEDDTPPALVQRSDNQIPVEEPVNSIEEYPTTPGGSAHMREYYLDSSSSVRRDHRFQNLERSSSLRGIGIREASGETDETKCVSNFKVSPESMDYFHGNTFPDSKDSIPNSSSLRDDCSESFESAYRDAAAIAGKGSKKSRRWIKVWNIWGLIHRRGSSKEDDYDRYSRGNVVDRSFSESWPELRRAANDVNGDSRRTFNGSRVFRSNSSVSWRNSFGNGTFAGMKSSSKEANGQSKKKREEFVLERNRSARFSPTHFDNGLLRFYLTPLRSSWNGGSGKGRPRTSHSIARSMLRLY